MQYAATKTAEAVSATLKDYLWLVRIREKYRQLHREHDQLLLRHQRLQQDMRELPRLQRLLGLKEGAHPEAVAARVIAKEVTPFFRAIRLSLDLTDRDRVRAGMPVLAPAGLVGQIRRSSGEYSDVLLIADRSSAVDVVVERTGARGVLKGTGASNAYTCRIAYLSADDAVSPGDQVVTSGLDKRFPAGIAVGQVTEVGHREVGLHQQVEVRPAVDFGKLQEVLIVPGLNAQALR